MITIASIANSCKSIEQQTIFLQWINRSPFPLNNKCRELKTMLVYHMLSHMRLKLRHSLCEMSFVHNKTSLQFKLQLSCTNELWRSAYKLLTISSIFSRFVEFHFGVNDALKLIIFTQWIRLIVSEFISRSHYINSIWFCWHNYSIEL